MRVRSLVFIMMALVTVIGCSQTEIRESNGNDRRKSSRSIFTKTNFNGQLLINQEAFEDYSSQDLAAKVTYQDRSVAVNLIFSQGVATIDFEGVDLKNADDLKIDFYVDDEATLTAVTPDFLFAKDNDSHTVRNCHIQQIKWDGEANGTNCNWSITTNK